MSDRWVLDTGCRARASRERQAPESSGPRGVARAERDSDGGPALTHWLGRWLTREICRGESGAG